MSHKSTNALLIGFSLLCCVCFSGCAPESDATKSARFDDVRGKCFATKADLFLVYSENGRNYSITPPACNDATSDMPPSVQEYQLHPEKFGRHTGPYIVDIIPAGTRISVTQLLDERGADDSLAFGKLMGGRNSGKEAGIWELLYDPDAPDSPTANSDRFEPNPAYLRPADCGK